MKLAEHVARLFLWICNRIDYNLRPITIKESLAIFTHDTHGPGPEELKGIVERALDADKAEDIATIHLDGQSALADYMIIASGTSSRHVASLAKKLKQRLEIQGVKSIHIEGMDRADWVAMDLGDIIVHLFRPEVRSFYNMEKMWGSLPISLVSSEQIQA